MTTYVPCPKCKGLGDRGWPPRKCKKCDGTGVVIDRTAPLQQEQSQLQGEDA